MVRSVQDTEYRPGDRPRKTGSKSRERGDSGILGAWSFKAWDTKIPAAKSTCTCTISVERKDVIPFDHFCKEPACRSGYNDHLGHNLFEYGARLYDGADRRRVYNVDNLMGRNPYQLHLDKNHPRNPNQVTPKGTNYHRVIWCNY